MIIRSALYILAAFTILIGMSGTPAAELCSPQAVIQHQENTLQKKNIIFDLSGVIFTHQTKLLAILEKTGYKQQLREKLFSILETIEPTNPTHIPAYDQNGDTPLPELMYQWLIDTRSGESICNHVLNEMKKNPQWFNNKFESIIIEHMTQKIFIPEKFASMQNFMIGAYNFVQELKTQGYNTYILSNWDSASFTYMQQKYPDFFTLFDGIVISGDVGYAKPDPKIYQILLERYNLNPKDCIFIDDQQCNVDAAFSCDIDSLVCPQQNGWLTTNTDFSALRDILLQRNIVIT